MKTIGRKIAHGFTLIELLVVIAIIGLLSTLAVVSLNNARAKSRDAKRVADMKQVASALELYYGDNNGYPVVAAATNIGEGTALTLSSAGFAAAGVAPVYMGAVPKDPTSTQHYAYTSKDAAGAACTTAPCASYGIAFTLEGTTAGLASGAHTVSPTGVN